MATTLGFSVLELCVPWPPWFKGSPSKALCEVGSGANMRWLAVAVLPLCHAFIAPRGAEVQPNIPQVQRLSNEPIGPSEARWGFGVMSAIAATSGVLGLRRRGRISLEAVKKNKSISKSSRLEGGAMMTVRKSKNNTHVALCDKKGEVVWATTEKRYGVLLPNANRAVEAALYVADKLGVESLILQIKGTPSALGGIIATVRNSGINVSQAYVRNNIAYGGSRPRLARRV
eukprot:s83_g18.t1